MPSKYHYHSSDALEVTGGGGREGGGAECLQAQKLEKKDRLNRIKEMSDLIRETAVRVYKYNHLS